MTARFPNEHRREKVCKKTQISRFSSTCDFFCVCLFCSRLGEKKTKQKRNKKTWYFREKTHLFFCTFFCFDNFVCFFSFPLSLGRTQEENSASKEWKMFVFSRENPPQFHIFCLQISCAIFFPLLGRKRKNCRCFRSKKRSRPDFSDKHTRKHVTNTTFVFRKQV